jgi:peptidoglycan/LPS O-acetylase OafA/YrhL
MHLNFNALPALIALAILVTVFAAIRRQQTRERVNLWLTGWAFILLRSVVEFAHSSNDWMAQIEHAIGLCAMVMASVAFVVSVAPQATTWRRQLVVSLVLGVPALAYTNAMLWGVNANRFYYAVVVLGLIAALLMLGAGTRKSLRTLSALACHWLDWPCWYGGASLPAIRIMEFS